MKINMKLIASLLIVPMATSTVESLLGKDCSDDASKCEVAGLKCASWSDSAEGDKKTCEDCSDGADKWISDSQRNFIQYECPPEIQPVDPEP